MGIADDRNDEILAREKYGRITKVARVCSYVAKVLFLLYLVGFAFLSVVRIMVIVDNQEPFSSIGVGDMVLGLLTGLLTLVLLGITASIFGAVAKSGRVFHSSIVGKLKVASAILLASALLQTALSSSFISFVTMGSLEFGYATVGDAIPIDASGIAVAVVFYCLALVYEYGVYLQFESDNTV